MTSLGSRDLDWCADHHGTREWEGHVLVRRWESNVAAVWGQRVTQWGSIWEHTTKQAYVHVHEKQKVSTAITVHHQHNWLGTSPDGT